MKYTNVLEKLLCLFNIVKTSWVDITFLAIVIVSLILLFRKKISRRTCYIINVISSIILIAVVIFNNIDVLSLTMDSVVDYTFTNIYFPSVYVYLLILLVMNVFCILSLFKVRLEKKYKTVNGVSILIINFILAIILDIVAKDKVDLFKKESIFTNTNLVTMMELSVNIFMVWCVINLIMYLADNITERLVIRKNAKVLDKGKVDMTALAVEIKEEEVKEEYVDDTNGIGNEEVKNKFIPVNTINFDNNSVDISQNHFIPDINKINNNIVDNGFDLSSLIPKRNEVSPITSNIVDNYINNNVNYVDNNGAVTEHNYTNSSELLNSILNNDLPFVIKEEKNERDTYTLNDYRIFNKMLKDIKEHNANSRISIDKNLEYRLITKYSTEAYEIFKKMLKNYSN